MLFHRHRGERVSRSFSELCEPASIHGPVCILEVYTSEKESEKERERERVRRILVGARCRYIDEVGVGSRKDKSVGRGRPIST